MALHRTNFRTGYALSAINLKTGRTIFIVSISGSKSRSTIGSSLFKKLQSGKTRLETVSEMIGLNPNKWEWAKKSADGVIQGDWAIRFDGRTALDIDRSGEGESIYN